LIRSGRCALLAAFASVLLASCATSEPDVPFGFAAAGLTPAQLQQQPEAAAAESTGEQADAVMVSTFVVEEGDPVLPDMIAAAPVLRPGSEQAADVPVPALAAAATPAATQPATSAFAAGIAPVPALAASEERETIDAAQGTTPAASDGEAAMQVAALAPAAPMQAKKRGFLSSFFAPAPQQPQAARPLIDPAATRQSEASAATSAAPARPLVQFASAGQPARPLVATNAAQGATPLPGVREGNALYEISRRSGMDDDSDIDLHEGDEPGLQLASAAGLARLAPNGLMKQTDNVDVACLKPSLVRVLKAIEKQYGRKVVVTSGYRSPDRNKRARGARNSLHMYCAAADVQVEGISKWDLAKFVRTMPGRGGVGTYCHTDSVHIDVGPERDWNWRCRRRK
jgi:uncharacterized protein YcbK (DUF882 family)